jgi:hypothetical protein
MFEIIKEPLPVVNSLLANLNVGHKKAQKAQIFGGQF